MRETIRYADVELTIVDCEGCGHDTEIRFPAEQLWDASLEDALSEARKKIRRRYQTAPPDSMPLSED